MTLEEVRTLFKYNAWANERLLSALGSLDPERFARHLKASHGSIRGTLAHLAAAEWIWLERLRGHSPNQLLPEAEFETIEMATRRLAEIDRELWDYVTGLNETDLEGRKDYVTTEGKPYSNVLRDMLLHLINHSSYHRGQVASLLRQVGATPLATDLILYLRALSP
jgi:uncharacterized damage-inducible protein DinB